MPVRVLLHHRGARPDPPINQYYTYGVHNLSNKIGYYYVDNNQTGGATATLCYGYNGVNCTGGTIKAGEICWKDLTPINSIRLNP